MIIFLTIYAIFVTIMLVYMYWEPKFELKLTVDEQYNNYTLYILYLHGSENNCKYTEKKLFTIKKKIKNK